MPVTDNHGTGVCGAECADGTECQRPAARDSDTGHCLDHSPGLDGTSAGEECRECRRPAVTAGLCPFHLSDADSLRDSVDDDARGTPGAFRDAGDGSASGGQQDVATDGGRPDVTGQTTLGDF